jgi:hypothetical protein
MLSVEAVQERLIWVGETAVAVTPVGTEGAMVSGGGGVVTDTAADCAEALPAASTAETVKEYVVLAASPVIDTVVLVGEAASVPSRYTR